MDQGKFDIEYDGSLILKSTEIFGNINAVRDICLEGVIWGNVQCAGRVIVREHALIQGDVNCNQLWICGCIEGNVCVTGKAVLKETAVIKGGLITDSLEYTPGAVIAAGLRLKKASN